MGVGIPGFEFQLPANRLNAGLTLLEQEAVQPAQQGPLGARVAFPLPKRGAPGRRQCYAQGGGAGHLAPGASQRPEFRIERSEIPEHCGVLLNVFCLLSFWVMFLLPGS